VKEQNDDKPRGRVPQTRQEEVVKRLCHIVKHVMHHTNYKHAGDCFCVQAVDAEYRIGSFQFDEYILRFVEQAVLEKVEHEKLLKQLEQSEGGV
jgi:hypothetical protein